LREHWYDVSSGQYRVPYLKPNPVTLLVASIKGTRRANKQKVRPSLDLKEDLLIEMSARQSVHVKKWVKALLFKEVGQQPRQF
jgi:hypothetical protein